MSLLQTPCEIKDPGYVEIRHTPSSAVTKGSVVVVGSQVLVAIADVAADKEGSFVVEASKARIAKDNTVAMTEGDEVFWDVADDQVNKTALDNTSCGFVLKAAAETDTEVEIVLRGLNKA